MGWLNRLFGKRGSIATQAKHKDLGGGVTPELLEAALRDGAIHVAALGRLSLAIKKIETARLVAKIGALAADIYEDLKKDPKDLNVARDFVDHHAPKSVELIESYVRVLHDDPESPALLHTELALQEIHQTFKLILKKCKEDDRIGLEIESKKLWAILEMERPQFPRNR